MGWTSWTVSEYGSMASFITLSTAEDCLAKKGRRILIKKKVWICMHSVNSSSRFALIASTFSICES
jgi:hypothetical protein